jgi:tyrosinase
MCKDLKCLEAIHGNVHDWVGGLMGNKSTSAADPIFFFHHSFIDFIWEMWRTKHQTREERETVYPIDHSACSIEKHFKVKYLTGGDPLLGNL